MPKSPAFRFYPSDFVGSPTVQAMDLHEVGAYTLLLCTAWNAERHGYLPDDENLLRRWARMTREQWVESRSLLLSKFPVVESGWRANPRMVEEAEKQRSFSESQRIKSDKRWGKPTLYQSDAENMPGDNEEDTGDIPSVSVSVSAFVSGTASESKEQIQRVLRVYDAYPSKVGKGAALKSIEKTFKLLRQRNEPNPEKFLVGRIEGWIEKRNRDAAAGKFVPEYPNPATWFNQGRYDDEDNLPKPKREVHVMTQREVDEDNYRHLGTPPPDEWAPVGAPQGWVPCRN